MAAAHETTLVRLGGKFAFVLFIMVLLAFVVEAQLTQYLQTALGYKQPYFIFYIVHSSFSLSFPIHLIYVLLRTKHGLRSLLSGLNFSITAQLTACNFQGSRSSPLANLFIIIMTITTFYNIPALLWFAAVPLSSVTDLTAIWNANAFFAYIFSVKLLGLEWGKLRLFAVSLATLGVVTVVYGGSIGSSSDPEPFKENLTNTSTPFVGDMLTLVASLVYGLYQVLYKKYIALSSNPVLNSDSAHYRQLSTSIDNIADEEPSACAVVADNMVYPPPFGLHPNLITTSIGLCTLFVFWIPIPILHYYQIEEFRLPPNAVTAIAIAGIATSGVVFSAGYMVLLGVWGPVVASVGNLLTIVLSVFSDLIFGTVPLTLAGALGAGMIVGAFGVLVYDMF
ncbi:hypothetical protein PAXRUDRAFT_826138 [Paxillus rubicundulus Ve08.2h10]|uniref:EamA domain-containing protein n=1 Tax=Paxillus rubicundulus Ve08.2h10 TaxID=930991 RepID=A0A0D0DSA4_9AGAM|nr:hypothetical protein PAXRUDRAFT_826138 [Paxillus rubicundulus Ve08.2h10]